VKVRLDFRPDLLWEDDEAEGTVDTQAKVVDPVQFLSLYDIQSLSVQWVGDLRVHSQ